jgi:hypothetical protein
MDNAQQVKILSTQQGNKIIVLEYKVAVLEHKVAELEHKATPETYGRLSLSLPS